MAGLLDFLNTDDGKLGLAMLAAAGPSAVPQSFGQRLQGAMQTMDAEKANKLKMGLLDMESQKGGLEMQQLRQKMADEQAARQVMQSFYQGAVPGAPRPAGGGATGAVNAALPANLQIGALPATPGFAQQSAVPPKADLYSQYMGLSQAFAQQGLTTQAQHYAELADKHRPKYSTTPQQMMVGGKLVNVLVSEDGTAKTLDGFEVKPDMVEQDLGGVKQWINKNSLTPGQTFTKTMTPGEVASNAVAWANNRATLRGQDLTDARARDTLEQGKTQLLNDPNQGPVLVNKNTGVSKPVVQQDGTRLPGEAVTKQVVGSRKALDIINDADKLIKGATGSYIGHGVDVGAQAFGYSTPGAENIAKLKALEGSLMMAQPRMEGPQSDKDVALYRQMAGQIGDPTVPRDIKAAALETIRSLHERYAGVAPGSSKPPAPVKPPPVPMKGMVRNGYRFKGGDPADPASWEKQ